MGGDDFGEYFDPKDGDSRASCTPKTTLMLSATATHLSLRWCLPHSAATATRLRSPHTGAFFCAEPGCVDKGKRADAN
ncbi:hypothetical protein ACPA9J_03105 [Pseudomonas aeruginosa]